MNTSIIKNTIRIKESSNLSIIVPALQVIQARFRIEIIPSVTEGVYFCHCARCCKNIPPAVVGVGGYYCFCCCVGYCNDVSLQVPCVEVGFRSVIEPYKQAAFVVEEVQEAASCLLSEQLRAVPVVFRGDAVDRFAGAQALFIILVRNGCVSVYQCCQLSAVLPCERHTAVSKRVAYCVVGDGFAVETCKLILPVGIFVGVGYGVCRGESRYVRNGRAIGVLRARENIPAVIVNVNF